MISSHLSKSSQFQGFHTVFKSLYSSQYWLTIGSDQFWIYLSIWHRFVLSLINTLATQLIEIVLAFAILKNPKKLLIYRKM